MTSKTTNEFAPDLRSRAVRMVFEHEGDHVSRWAAISAEIGCTPEALRLWVTRAERESSRFDGVAPDLSTRLKAVGPASRDATASRWGSNSPGGGISGSPSTCHRAAR